MEWLYQKRRGPEWKQGWTGQTLGTVSSPPPQLLTIFGIVIVLLWFPQFTIYKAEIQHQTASSFQLLLFLFPFLLIIFMSLYSTSGLINFRFRQWATEPIQRGGLPWGMVILVPLILVLLYSQSSFH